MRRILLAVLAVAAVLVTACGGGAPAPTAAPTATTEPATTTTEVSTEPAPEAPTATTGSAPEASTVTPEPTTDAQVPATDTTTTAADQPTPAPEAADTDPEAPTAAPASSAVVATATAALEVFTEPGGAQQTVLAPQTSFGSATTLLVHAEHGDWLEVGLPIRPNGSTGFVRRADVSLARVDYRVEVDLDERHLTVFDGDDVVLEAPVAVGTDDNPTPVGLFSVTDVLATPGAGSPYGPYALGLSAHSDTLSEFAGGDGQIGLHGTDDPASIGQKVSHGCIRVDDSVIVQLAAMLPLGTPVVIGV